jgi:plastocyanin
MQTETRARRPWTLAVVALAAAVLLLAAGCGGGDDDDNGSGGGGGGGGGGTINVSADPSGALKYEQTTLTAPAGSDTIQFTNDSTVPHDVAIKKDSDEIGKTDTITASSTSTTVDLDPGTYTFYCTVPGHEQAGMSGTLTVK